MNAFAIDDRLAADTLPLCQSSLTLVRVSRDVRFPWLILIPKRAGLADLIDLDPADDVTIMAEIRAVSSALREITRCDKLNVASLGNQVRQLHIHLVARFEHDPAWPGPIWGVGTPQTSDSPPAWADEVRDHLGWVS